MNDDTDFVDYEDVAVVTATPETTHPPAHPRVMSAVRYLLNRHELSTGTPIPQMIAVVSALRGEGVTTVSRSLAEVLSSDNSSKICWIDLGALYPSSRHDQRANAARLRDPNDSAPNAKHLERHRAAPELPVRLVPTDREEISEQRVDVGPPEVENVLEHLAAEYSHVVFDTPPLLADRDALGFLRHADAYILVTQQGSTTRNQVKQVADELRSIPSLGAILNKHRTQTPRAVRRYFSE